MRVDTISSGMLDSYAKRSDTVIVDVRDKSEFAKMHICGAINIPMEEIESFYPERNKLLVFYCDRGAASIMAAAQMSRRGYSSKSVVGGIAAYRGKNICSSYKNNV
jgi:rhodanese-related sulfurtransferase